MLGFFAHNNASSTMAPATAPAPATPYASFTRATPFADNGSFTRAFFTYVFVCTASYASFTRATPFADNGSFAWASLFANAWHILYMKIIYDIFFDQGLI